jgi:YHS domain-containing protein
MSHLVKDHDVFVDPISHHAVSPETARVKSFYNGRMYYFEDRTNKQVFERDPELWIPTPHASMNSSSISPTDE